MVVDYIDTHRDRIVEGRALGVKPICRADFEGQSKPRQKGLYAGVVDAVGGEVLANAIASTVPGWLGTAGTVPALLLPPLIGALAFPPPPTDA